LRTGELQLTLFEELLETVAELSAEDDRQSADREQPLRAERYPTLALQRESASGDDAVKVVMVQKVLGPGMENGGDPQDRFEVVATEFHQCGRCAGEQEGVEERLVVLNERVEFVREREHIVEVRDGQQEVNLLLQPLGAFELLAARTMPVSARVRYEVFLPAMGTLVLMAAQRWGVTGRDGAKNLPMMSRQAMSLREARQCGSHDFAQGDGLRLTGLRATGHRSLRDCRLSALPSPAKIDQV